MDRASRKRKFDCQDFAIFLNTSPRTTKNVKGFHSRFYEHDLFHVFTPYGMYAPDGEEFEEFIRNNHCVIWLIIKGRAPPSQGYYQFPDEQNYHPELRASG